MSSNSFSDVGTMIDSGVDINRVNVYNIFSNYFDNPRMRRIQDLQGGTYVLYGCKIRSMLAKDNRYLFACIHVSKAKRTDEFLEDLEWVTFETRTLAEELNVPIHSYSRKRLDNVINVLTKGEKEFNYTCPDYDLAVRLLVGKSQIRPYNDRGTLGLALETYNTIIAF